MCVLCCVTFLVCPCPVCVCVCKCLLCSPLCAAPPQTPRKLFMVMDFVGGGDFFSLLSREGGMPEDRVRLYTAELVCALGHLHDRGIVYRDLKPENVLLDGQGHVKLTDFGLSRCVCAPLRGCVV